MSKLQRDVFGDEDVGKVSFLSRWWRSVDRITVFCIVTLSMVGLLLGMASSASLAERHNLNEFHFVIRQAVFVGIALGLMVIISMLHRSTILKLSVPVTIVIMALLFLLPLIGTDFGKGAKRWISIAGQSVQPSEFFKPFFAVVAGSLLAGATRGHLVSSVHYSAGLMLLTAVVLAAQPDFGQAGLIFACWILMYLVSGSSVVGMATIGGVVGGLGVAAYFESEHVARRINSFLSPSVDPNEQVGYSMRAIENGGMFGAGIGEGTVKFTLPDAHTDFIVAVAAEEYGFFMVALILFLYLTVVMRAFIKAMHETDQVKRVVSCGLSGLIGIQALINIGVSVKFFPAKGMTLPFISYGGSSVLAIGITAGLLLAFSRREVDLVR